MPKVCASRTRVSLATNYPNYAWNVLQTDMLRHSDKVHSQPAHSREVQCRCWPSGASQHRYEAIPNNILLPTTSRHQNFKKNDVFVQNKYHVLIIFVARTQESINTYIHADKDGQQHGAAYAGNSRSHANIPVL